MSRQWSTGTLQSIRIRVDGVTYNTTRGHGPSVLRTWLGLCTIMYRRQNWNGTHHVRNDVTTSFGFNVCYMQCMSSVTMIVRRNGVNPHSTILYNNFTFTTPVHRISNRSISKETWMHESNNSRSSEHKLSLKWYWYLFYIRNLSLLEPMPLKCVLFHW